MKEFAECEFVSGAGRGISHVVLAPRNLLLSLDDLYGLRERELQPGRPVRHQTALPVRPRFDDDDFDVDGFLLVFFELSTFPIPAITLRPEIQTVLRLIGRPVSAGKALAIACRLVAPHSRKRGATNLDERAMIVAWKVRLTEKVRLLAAQLERRNRISNSSI